MLTAVEEWLKKQIANKDKNWWTKVVAGLSFLAIGLFLYFRYSFLKDKLFTAELENVLINDDKADAIRKAKLEAIEKSRAEALGKANVAQKKAQDLAQAVKPIEQVAKSEKEVIQNIDSWEELDKVVKDK